MNARERAAARDEIARKQLGLDGQPGPVEMDAGVRKAYAWAAEVLDRYQPGRVAKCVYCGGPSTKKRYLRTCHAHQDLPLYDPAFRDELVLRGVA